MIFTTFRGVLTLGLTSAFAFVQLGVPSVLGSVSFTSILTLVCFGLALIYFLFFWSHLSDALRRPNSPQWRLAMIGIFLVLPGLIDSSIWIMKCSPSGIPLVWPCSEFYPNYFPLGFLALQFALLAWVFIARLVRGGTARRGK